MQTPFQAFLNLTSDAAQFLFAWSWQVFLLLAAVYLIIRLFRFRAAAIRYRIWFVGVLAVALLPFITVLIQNFTSQQSKPATLNLIVDAPRIVVAAPQVQSQPAPLIHPVASESFSAKNLWSCLFAIWAIGFGIALWRLMRSYWQSRRARQHGRCVSFVELGCKDLKEVLDCKLSGTVASPVLIGLWHPVILLPADILMWTTAEERRAILLHELVHAQRKDHWENFFQAILGAVFYFHPAVRYTCKQLCIERELSCDEQVLQFGTEASAYVESILKVAEKSIASDALHQPAFITKKMLERRIEMIMKGDRSIWSARRWTLLILPVALIAVMIWVIVPNRSASAQQSQEDLEMHRKIERENMEREKEARLKNKLLAKESDGRSETELREHREIEIKQALMSAEVLAQVSDKQLLTGRQYNNKEDLIDVSAEQTNRVGEESIHTNVVVKTPEFTFKGEHAEERNGIVNIVGSPIEVEHNGRVFYSYNAIAVAQRFGAVLYVVSKHGNLYTEKDQFSKTVEFGELLHRSLGR